MNILSGVLRAHQAIYEATGGLIGHRILGVPTLLLSTTGRRSGQRRTSALFYTRDGERQIVVASNGGDSKPPAWLLNLQANPQVEVQIGRNKHPATASEIEPGDGDYDRLWKAVNRANSGRYDVYQSRTKRPISLVALTPS
ncbi:MAG: nitroreductase family deazaflavin-dependent oxidoreductase [Acidimicrobiia bacterium]